MKTPSTEIVCSPGSLSSKEDERRDARRLIESRGGTSEACQPTRISEFKQHASVDLLQFAKDVSLGATATAVDELAFIALVERLASLMTGPREVTKFLRLALLRRVNAINSNMWRTMSLAGSEAVCLTGSGVSYVVGSDHLAAFPPTEYVIPIGSKEAAGVDYEWLFQQWTDNAKWKWSTDATPSDKGIVKKGEQKPRV